MHGQQNIKICNMCQHSRILAKMWQNLQIVCTKTYTIYDLSSCLVIFSIRCIDSQFPGCTLGTDWLLLQTWSVSSS